MQTKEDKVIPVISFYGAEIRNGETPVIYNMDMTLV